MGGPVCTGSNERVHLNSLEIRSYSLERKHRLEREPRARDGSGSLTKPMRSRCASEEATAGSYRSGSIRPQRRGSYSGQPGDC